MLPVPNWLLDCAIFWLFEQNFQS